MMASPQRGRTPDSLVLPPFQPPTPSATTRPHHSHQHHAHHSHPHAHAHAHAHSLRAHPSSRIAPAPASSSPSQARLPPARDGHDLMNAFPNPPPPVPDEYGRARFNQSERAFLSSRAGERTRDRPSTSASSMSTAASAASRSAASTTTRDRDRSGTDASGSNQRSFIRLPPLVKSGEPPSDPNLSRLRASPFPPAYLGKCTPPGAHLVSCRHSSHN